jgi:hypothetical protein
MEGIDPISIHPVNIHLDPVEKDISLRDDQRESERADELSSKRKRDEYKIDKNSTNPYDLDLEINPAMLSGPGPHIGLSYSCFGSCCHRSCTCTGTCSCTCAGCW